MYASTHTFGADCEIHYRAGFAELLVLEHLGLRVHQRVQIAENEWPEEEVSPAGDFAAEINEIILPLAHLQCPHPNLGRRISAVNGVHVMRQAPAAAAGFFGRISVRAPNRRA
jgi:hypothetical protein